MKILAVDDNKDNVQMIADIVGMLGHEVVRAFDGSQALNAVETNPPDLILLDVNMPGMTGFEVVEHLKADERTARIPIILLTALSEVEQRVKGLGLGADDYLTKPFSPRELAARIETRLRAKADTDGLLQAQQMIRKTFQRFVAPSVVEQMLSNPASVELGGHLQDVTVLFADIENFTTLAEHFDPSELLGLLNQYHEMMVEIVLANGGTIDKFIGDAVMALYNTPLPQVDHPLRAVKTATEIIRALPDFHDRLPESSRLKINFGVHSGSAIVGNVGSPEIMDYTAVGDTVNVAARLQSLSENGQILISEATQIQLGEQFTFQYIGPVPVKGRQRPVLVYEIRL